MCLQDLQMFRRTQSNLYQATAADLALPPNPMRLRLIVTARSMVVTIFAASNGSDNTKALAAAGWATAAADFPVETLIMRLEEFGSVLLGEFFIKRLAATGECYVTEVVALPDLDRLIANGGK